jgi:6-O-methylguanine DNA methyltransferase-like protein
LKSKFTSRTSWREKLERPQEARLVKVPPKMSRFGKGMMLIPTPSLVNGLLRKVPRGKLVTVGTIREKLARDHEADVTCPLTTGIFVRIVAEAAEEDRGQNKKRITPYWRVVRDDGSLNPKFPGGIDQQTRYLRAEGFSVVKSGRKQPAVKDFEQRLFRFDL